MYKLYESKKRHTIVHFKDRNQKINFSTILIRYGRLLSNGNIQPLGTEALFDSEKCTFDICVLEQQKLCSTTFFCYLASGSRLERVKFRKNAAT